ncbi:MAG: Ribophorin I [Benniella sp.]|nr:MAG: Ribophorin I [Benniella sp.]
MYFSRQALVAFVASLILSSVAMAQEEDWSEDVDETLLGPSDLKITNLLRTLDLSKPRIREITSAAVQNVGTENATEYYHPVDQVYFERLSHIIAENRKTKESLEIVRDDEIFDQEYQFFKVKLSPPLPPGEKMQITIKSSFTGIVRPFPTHAAQDERQRFLYFGNAFALTAYSSDKQKTTVVVPNSNLEVVTYPEETELAVKNNQITLGPYKDVAGLEHGVFEVQYELVGAVPHVNHLRRDIEISQWGNNLAVEEHYKFENKGAHLKGHFSRIDYQRNPMSARDGNAVLAFQMPIPKLARDIYYRDEIGNISTSSLTHQSDHVVLTLAPRFPIFGGWKTTFYTGYNVPLDGYLRRVPDSDKYILKVPVIVPLKDTSYDEIDIRVVLPEGAKKARVHMPYEVDFIGQSTTKTYMDSAGRYTITIEAKNLIEEHGRDMFIEYELPMAAYFTKPLAASAMLMAIFASSMVLNRLDFKIGGSILKK